jgi:hypothetical protein
MRVTRTLVAVAIVKTASGPGSSEELESKGASSMSTGGEDSEDTDETDGEESDEASVGKPSAENQAPAGDKTASQVSNIGV